jgi:hypothetical protein
VKEDEMDSAYTTYREEKKVWIGYRWEIQKERDYYEGRIILK